jgi:tetratricopeptide (TPR) repeat protein
VASFGLFWLIVAFLPVSNLLVPAGFVTAERTLFLPSVGVLLVAGALAQWIRSRAQGSESRLGLAVLSLLLVLGLARSIDRQRVWKNNDVFANALVKDSPDGYRAHFIRGRALGYEKGDFAEMMREYHRALRLFPYDASMTLTMADGYTRAGMFEPAAELFRWTYAVEPETAAGRYEYVYSLSRLERWDAVRVEALKGLRLVSGPDVQLMRKAIAYSDSVSGRGRFRP